MNNQNIFERFATRNQEDNFLPVTPTASQEPENEFTNAVNDSAKLSGQSSGNIFDRLSEKQKEKEKNSLGLFDTLRDIGEQVVSKGVAGIGGAYGNLADTFGLQVQPGQTLPGEEARNAQQFQVLEKLNRGEVPSFGEFMLLSDDDFPSYNRLPTSKEIQGGIEGVTGIGEGKTPAGRIAGRGAEFLGEGAATGGGAKALLGLAASGLAGQGIREAGGPEWAASGTEIAGSLAPSVISKKLVPSGKAAKDTLEAGRHLGLTEELITPLIQGEKKVATLSKVARKGSRTKEVFGKIKEKLGDSYNTIKSSSQAKVKLPNADQINLRKEFSTIRNELSKTLAPSPDREAALNFIEKSLETLRNTNVTPEYLVNFWQDINKAVKWNSINGGKKALAQLKEPISNIMQKVSPALAKDFEMTNQLYSKYAQISKKLKPDLIDSIVNKAEILGAPAAGLALAQGNPWALVGLGSEAAIRLLSREMLINPYFQNVAKKLVTNFNSSSLKGVGESVKQVQEYMKRKHPNEDWAFLTDTYKEDEED